MTDWRCSSCDRPLRATSAKADGVTVRHQAHGLCAPCYAKIHRTAKVRRDAASRATVKRPHRTIRRFPSDVWPGRP